MITQDGMRENLLIPLFEDGKLLRQTSLSEIKNKLKENNVKN